MKFNVSGKQFQQQLQAVSKVINAKNALAILDNFLLRVEGDRLSITGSDQENVMTAYMEVTDSDGDGSIAVSAKRLLEIVKEVANQPLTFDVNEETAEVDVSFLSGHFNFMGIDPTEYPARRRSEEEQRTLIIPASMVRKGIENTLFAASTDNVRPIMTGIFWDIHENDITFVSSDTHKLVRYINSEKAPSMTASFILPAKPANILKGIISGDDADVKITFDSKGATFEFGDYILSCLFIKGNYPNYNRVIPAENPYAMTIDRVTLLAALRRAMIFAAKSSNLVVLDISDNDVHLTAQDLDYSTKAEEHVSCEYEGNPITIGFNGNFMIEILNNLHDDSIVLKLSDPARPGVYTPLRQDEGEDTVTIQMPMQVL